MKIAIITIATGKYFKLLEPLFTSIKKFMFVNHEVTPIAFSDGKLDGYNIVYTPFLPVPLNALFKFRYINSIDLSGYDMIFLIDGDCLVVAPIEDDIFPNNNDQIVVVQHPWEKLNAASYEKNPLSTAFVDNKETQYYQSCFLGAYRDTFLKMSKEIESNIEIDLKNRIIAKWYDESHVNRYAVHHPHKQIHSGYAYPDIYISESPSWFVFEKKIIHYNKGSK